MEMDTGKDSDTLGQRDICILKCPFCENKYVSPCIYRTHLMAHVVYHSDKNLFVCGICPRNGDDIMEIVLHIEKTHSERTQGALDEVGCENCVQSYRLYRKIRYI